MKRLALAFLLFSSFACTRSPEFQRDQEYTHDDSAPPPVSYYSAKNKTPSQRVESMGQPKKRVFVLNFWNDTPIKQNDFGVFTADELRRNLYRTQRLILPLDVRTELATSDFVEGERVKVAQLIREGRRLGVSVLMIGRIAKAVFRQRGDDVGLLRQKQSLAAVDLEVKLFDIANGREISALSRSGEASSNAMVLTEGASIESPQYRAELLKLATRNAVSLLVPDLLKSIEKMGWEGRIAKVVGTKVYVNAGKASGLIPGDILKVIAPGDEIYDPASGAFLGRSQGQLKGTLEVVDYIGADGAVADIHTGSNFREGDSVTLY